MSFAVPRGPPFGTNASLRLQLALIALIQKNNHLHICKAACPSPSPSPAISSCRAETTRWQLAGIGEMTHPALGQEREGHDVRRVPGGRQNYAGHRLQHVQYGVAQANQSRPWGPCCQLQAVRYLMQLLQRGLRQPAVIASKVSRVRAPVCGRIQLFGILGNTIWPHVLCHARGVMRGAACIYEKHGIRPASDCQQEVTSPATLSPPADHAEQARCHASQ